MSKVLINGLLLTEHFTGVQYYTENLLRAMGLTNKNEIKLGILLPKNYTGNIRSNNNLIAHNTNINSLNRFNRIFFENFKLANFYRLNKYDLHHATSYVLPFFWNYPSVVTIHDLIALIHPEFCQRESAFYFKHFLPRTIKKAAKIIAVSKKVKDDILKQFEISPEIIKVIYLGVDNIFKKIQSEEALIKLKHTYKLPQQFILFVGNIEPKKNLARLIIAFNQLKQQTETNHKLVIVGRNGWKYKSVYSLISALKIDSEILFTGYVPREDLAGIYSLADVFVFPSLYEGFGIPPLEAMACETPVIVSSHGALPETTGGNCLQVDPYDVDDITKTINKLLTDNALKKRTIEDGKKWVKNFTWEKAAEETLRIYENLSSEKCGKNNI
jgi:glycosyltransferase involved in cell wall biosynthesis